MSPFEIEVLPEVDVPAEYLEVVHEAAVAALKGEGQTEGASCTVLLTSENRIRELNRTYLGNDKATDVLSFPAGEPMPGAPSYLGDIAISVVTAERNARRGGHDVPSELQLLTVHAILHLLGHDHASEAQKRVMWAAQSGILTAMGAGITEPKIG